MTATRTATVEVTSVLETPIAPANGYGAFGTSPTCGSLQFQGSSNIDSYDSSAALVGGNPVIAHSGGNVGTNGNLGESGNATIDGTLSSPRVGVGACSAGNVDALSSSGNAKLCPDPIAGMQRHPARRRRQSAGRRRAADAGSAQSAAAGRVLQRRTTRHCGNGASVGDVTVNSQQDA